MLSRITTVILALGLTATAWSQTTAFTYQGLLSENGGPVTGTYDFEFRLFAAASGGSEIGSVVALDEVAVAGGLFTVTLDFGAVFDGAGRFIEIAVRPGASTDAYTGLSPRQAVTATPYALNAASLMSPASSPLDIRVGGVRALRLEPTLGAPNFIAGAGENSVTAGASGAAIGGGLANRMGGSFAVIAGGATNVADAQSSAIGGGNRNTIDAFAEGATIGGGLLNTASDRAATVGGGSVNTASGQHSTVAGGYRNLVDGNYSFVGGGGLNAATGVGSFIGGGGNGEFFVERGTNHVASGEFSAVVGGTANTASGRHSFVGGGRINLASGDGAFVGGGRESAAGGLVTNNIASGANSVVGGGRLNVAGGAQATIPGGEGNRADGGFSTAIGSGNRATGFYAIALGYDNHAAGNYSMAAGVRSRSSHQGTLVWADASPAELFSAADNSVTLRAAGGYRLFSNSDATIGASLAPNQNSWSTLSDRHRKKDIQPLDGRAILDKLAAVPLSTWHYDFEPSDATPHIGPMAQDFKAAFYPGRDDRSITTHEFDGVALAAIQGLNQKVEEGGRTLERRLEQKETEIAELQQQNADLLRRLAALEARLR